MPKQYHSSFDKNLTFSNWPESHQSFWATFVSSGSGGQVVRLLACLEGTPTIWELNAEGTDNQFKALDNWV